jgi:protein TonB
VRQCLADGELDQAEEILRQGLERHPDEAGLQQLHQELGAKRAYREEWRTAQVLFGRGQCQEAEGILVRLLSQEPENADAQAMLEAVRGARADSEEENFYARGREKAIRLMRERQFHAAADLLRNLLSLFPGDPILQRDLQTALDGQNSAPHPAVVAAAEVAPPAHFPQAPSILAEVVPIDSITPLVPRPGPHLAPRLQELVTAPDRRLLVAIPLVLLVAAGATLWKSRPKPGAPPAPRATVSPANLVPRKVSDPTPAAAQPAPSTSTAEPPPVVAAPAPPQPVLSTSRSQAKSAARSKRASVPPPPAPRTTVPDVGPTVPAVEINSPEGSASAAAAPTRGAGNFQQPKLLQGRMPTTPQLSGYRGMSGAVVLEAVVDRTGVVTAATVQSGLPLLAQIAKDQVLTWRYQPGRLNGEPVDSKVTIRILFQPAPRAK